MPILKLPNAGDTATLSLTGAEEVQGKWGAQVAFHAGDNTLYLPAESAKRQLARLGMTNLADAIGATLIFSRSPNPKGDIPYWNIDQSTDQHQATAAPAAKRAAPVKRPASTAAPAASPDGWAALASSYGRCVGIARRVIGALPGATIADVRSGADTLFIQAAKQGLLSAPVAEPTVPSAVIQAFDAVPAPLAASFADDDGLPF